MTPFDYQPEHDGQNHINVYSRGRTALGRLLSNFARTPFIHPTYGPFQSIEGLWYWLGCSGADREQLRELSGWQAKQRGRELRAPDWPDHADFQQEILDGLAAKFDQTPELKRLFAATRPLPLDHYYVMRNGHVVRPTQGRWMLEQWEQQWWAWWLFANEVEA